MEQAEAASLYRDPIHPYSRALIGAYPSLLGEKRTLKSIPGAPPRLINPPAGCLFEPRCEHAVAACRNEEPPTMEIDGHIVACHLTGVGSKQRK